MSISISTTIIPSSLHPNPLASSSSSSSKALPSYSVFHSPPRKMSKCFKVHAKIGGGDGDVNKGGKKKFITREQEPEQYWQTAGERKGENPMSTPLPYIIIFAGGLGHGVAHAVFFFLSNHGLKEGKRDLSYQKWSYQIGLKGEAMNLVSPNEVSSTEWMDVSLVAQKQQPLTWFKSHFDAPWGNEPLALDMGSMGKGQVWINGESIGRYWTAYADGDCNECNYAGTYRPPKCQVGCGKPTQRWYHVPRAWLKPTNNLLVVFEEIGGDASGITLVKRSVNSVCADVAEWHPTLKNWHIESYGKSETLHRPKVHLHCASGQSISTIKFASFGTPLGTCGSFQQGRCHSTSSYSTLEKRCIGQQRCSVTISATNFGGDPCPNVLKRVAVEAICAPKN